MSVANPTGSELFTLVVTKAHLGNPDDTWDNTYELQAASSPTLEKLVASCSKVLAFEQAIHLNSTRFTQYRLSTRTADSQPYNPDNFKTQPLSGYLGLRASDVNSEPLFMVGNCAKAMLTGKQGKLAYRNILTEADVQSSGGKAVLSNSAAFESLISDAKSSSGLNALLSNGLTNEDFSDKIVLVSSNGLTVRVVIDIVFSRIGSLKTKFNRLQTTEQRLASSLARRSQKNPPLLIGG